MTEPDSPSVHYRREADRARRQAGKASDAITRQTLLDIADRYQSLAEAADAGESVSGCEPALPGL